MRLLRISHYPLGLIGAAVLSCGTDQQRSSADAGSGADSADAGAGRAGSGGAGGDDLRGGAGGALGGSGTAGQTGSNTGGGRTTGNGGTGSSAGGKNASGGAGAANGGMRSAGGTGSNDDGGVTGSSDLPTPPGPGGVPRPSGSASHLVVLPWAGLKSAVSYTFDDSQPSQLDHYADIAATGVRVTYYVTTSNKGLPNYDATWKKAAQAGDEIGNHTVNHCNRDLTNCSMSAGSAAAEIDQCTAYIASNLGQKDVWTMAYPYGDAAYEPDAKTRFFLARGVGGGMIAPSDSTNPFNLPIKAATGGEAASVFSDAIDAGHGQGKWLIFLFHSLLPGQNWYAGVDIGAVTQSIEHGKSLGDVWLDTVANVGSYWVGQKLVEGGAAGNAWTWTLPAHFPAGRFLRVKVDGGTLSQGGRALPWDGHGYYEVSLDAGALMWAP